MEQRAALPGTSDAAGETGAAQVTATGSVAARVRPGLSQAHGAASTVTQPLAAPHLRGLWPLVSLFLDQSLPGLSTTEASPVGGQDKAGTAAAHVHLQTGRSERVLLL